MGAVDVLERNLLSLLCPFSFLPSTRTPTLVLVYAVSSCPSFVQIPGVVIWLSAGFECVWEKPEHVAGSTDPASSFSEFQQPPAFSKILVCTSQEENRYFILFSKKRSRVSQPATTTPAPTHLRHSRLSDTSTLGHNRGNSTTCDPWHKVRLGWSGSPILDDLTSSLQHDESCPR